MPLALTPVDSRLLRSQPRPTVPPLLGTDRELLSGGDCPLITAAPYWTL